MIFLLILAFHREVVVPETLDLAVLTRTFANGVRDKSDSLFAFLAAILSPR